MVIALNMQCTDIHNYCNFRQCKYHYFEYSLIFLVDFFENFYRFPVKITFPRVMNTSKATCLYGLLVGIDARPLARY